MRQHFRISVGFSVINMQQKWIDDDLGMVSDPNYAYIYIYTHTLCITMYIHVPLHVQWYSPNMGSWTCLLKKQPELTGLPACSRFLRQVGAAQRHLHPRRGVKWWNLLVNGSWSIALPDHPRSNGKYLPTCLKLQKMGQMDSPWWRSFFTRRNQENMNRL